MKPEPKITFSCDVVGHPVLTVRMGSVIRDKTEYGWQLARIEYMRGVLTQLFNSSVYIVWLDR